MKLPIVLVHSEGRRQVGAYRPVFGDVNRRMACPLTRGAGAHGIDDDGAVLHSEERH